MPEDPSWPSSSLSLFEARNFASLERGERGGDHLASNEPRFAAMDGLGTLSTESRVQKIYILTDFDIVVWAKVCLLENVKKRIGKQWHKTVK